mmetsp:Transcript_15938/g.36471  ORF Transcript_15938/g.36471 Transcript_15938/m.36471 type:complete len:257 (-) Transcript_15938:575-1345(-)
MTGSRRITSTSSSAPNGGVLLAFRERRGRSANSRILPCSVEAQRCARNSLDRLDHLAGEHVGCLTGARRGECDRVLSPQAPVRRAELRRRANSNGRAVVAACVRVAAEGMERARDPRPEVSLVEVRAQPRAETAAPDGEASRADLGRAESPALQRREDGLPRQLRSPVAFDHRPPRGKFHARTPQTIAADEPSVVLVGAAGPSAELQRNEAIVVGQKHRVPSVERRSKEASHGGAIKVEHEALVVLHCPLQWRGQV